jgi:hypothetical protein
VTHCLWEVIDNSVDETLGSVHLGRHRPLGRGVFAMVGLAGKAKRAVAEAECRKYKTPDMLRQLLPYKQ